VDLSRLLISHKECYLRRVSVLRRIWKITLFALSPIPKVQEGMQALLLLATLLGIAVTPEEFSRLSLDFSVRFAILLGLLFVLFFIAAFRLEQQLTHRPITLEFDNFRARFGFGPTRKLTTKILTIFGFT
jgi:hypothetical protein